MGNRAVEVATAAEALGHCRVIGRGLLLLAAAAITATTTLTAQTSPAAESLLVAARRAARAWQQHDFPAFLRGSSGVLLQLPGTNPSAPLRPAQAAELLRAFVDGAAETAVEVLVARNVDSERAYVEIQRSYTVQGTSSPRSQTLYVGMRRFGGSYRVVEVRIVP